MVPQIDQINMILKLQLNQSINWQYWLKMLMMSSSLMLRQPMRVFMNNIFIYVYMTGRHLKPKDFFVSEYLIIFIISHPGSSNEYPQHMFFRRNRKNYPRINAKFSFLTSSLRGHQKTSLVFKIGSQNPKTAEKRTILPSE